MTEEILIYILLSIAIIYLGYKFLIPKKRKGNGGKDCDSCK